MLLLLGKYGYPQGSLPERSADQWQEVIKLNAGRINEKRIIAIPNETGFSEKIADPSSDRYAQRITVTPDPRTGMTANMYKHNQRKNLERSFKKYKTKLDEAFKTVGGQIAKKFCDAVDLAKSLFGEGSAARTMRATGTRLEGVGAAIIVPFFLTNHPDAMSKVRPGVDIVTTGGPVNVTLNGQQNVFVSMLTQVLTFSLIQADKSGLDPAVLTALNDRINHLVQSLVDPGLGLIPFATGGLSHVDIINDPVLGEMVSVSVNQI
jgi:hypothetical protein